MSPSAPIAKSAKAPGDAPPALHPPVWIGEGGVAIPGPVLPPAPPNGSPPTPAPLDGSPPPVGSPPTPPLPLAALLDDDADASTIRTLAHE